MARAEYLGPAKRRGPVLEAALEVFSRGGFEAASMAGIAERAGVSKAVLYDCFPGGKEEIYFSLLKKVEEDFLSHLDGAFGGQRGLPFEHALRGGMVAYLEFADVHPAAFRVIYGGAGTADPKVARRVVEVREGIIDRMRDRAVEVMGFDPAGGPVVELFVRAIVAVAEELARWSLDGPKLTREEMVELAVAWFMRGFEGLAPRT